MLKAQNFFEKIKVFNGSWLKIFAVAFMFVDHFAYLILPHIEIATESFFLFGKELTMIRICRLIGRLAFPIFAFLLTEGFIHTKSPKKYGFSLLVFAVISEIPYNLMLCGQVLNFTSQNVYFTLFLGFLALYILDNIKDDMHKTILVFCIVLLSILLKSDYGAKGVILIVLLYLLKNQRLLASVLSYGLLSGGLAAWCAFVPINMYNGERGFIKGKFMKYAFYAFYPVHMLVLVVIKKFIFL